VLAVDKVAHNALSSGKSVGFGVGVAETQLDDEDSACVSDIESDVRLGRWRIAGFGFLPYS
jgi:hypothetical protein